MIFNKKELAVILMLTGSGLLGWGIKGFRKHTQVTPDRFSVYADTVQYVSKKKVSKPAKKKAGKINLNSADRKELESIKGIGPALAGRILEYRAKHGPFQKTEDLLAVKGIGPKKLKKIAGVASVAPVKTEPSD